MKITHDHVNALAKGIEIGTSNLNMKSVINSYETGDFARSDKVKDLQRRFCFDMLHTIPASTINPLMSEIYRYANDDHLYTALKFICPTVTRKY